MGDARILDRLGAGKTPREVAEELGLRLSKVLAVQQHMQANRRLPRGKRS